MYLLMLTDAHWLKFCQAMNLPQAGDESLAQLRNRKKARDQVEGIVKAAMAALTFDQAASRLQAAGVGFTEVLPLERVLQAPQARHPGKLRDVTYRGLNFEIPEFPRLGAAWDVPTKPPAELGEHTLEVLLAAGVSALQCDQLVSSGAAAVADPRNFAWAAVRESKRLRE
ncbi:CoA transferase [Variovorax sp. RA8]|uniref:CoA transferase n=1 Tax=Variovorax sp. (strain JCM 16519 / RA8) TaxID=662548 RepID=UPI000AA75A54|nr:CoA transferase [Variovorax sp. RA8]VTU42024.1 putative acyl-CoA transferases/carnitine dehydratase [Variovorax sp. RA8]